MGQEDRCAARSERESLRLWRTAMTAIHHSLSTCNRAVTATCLKEAFADVAAAPAAAATARALEAFADVYAYMPGLFGGVTRLQATGKISTC